MRIIKVRNGRIDRRALATAAEIIEKGGVVVFPTDTAYGLAADPRSSFAVRKVFRVKGRPPGKPLPLIAADTAAVGARFVLRGKAASLARRHWPGPLTLVLPFKRGKKIAAAGKGTTGAVRVPASAWARALAAAAGGVVTSTSANISGESPIYAPSEIVRSFRGKAARPDLFLDAGRLRARPPSTIARLKRGTIEVLRQGPVHIRA